MTKRCSKCDKTKSVESFNVKRRNPDGRAAECKECTKETRLQTYNTHKSEIIRKAGIRRDRVRLDTRQKLYEYYLAHPCVECGESRPECLDMDHVSDNKISNVSRMVSSSTSWNSVKKEIDKCVVRCANCHRVKTAQTQGWYKDLVDHG